MFLSPIFRGCLGEAAVGNTEQSCKPRSISGPKDKVTEAIATARGHQSAGRVGRAGSLIWARGKKCCRWKRLMLRIESSDVRLSQERTS